MSKTELPPLPEPDVYLVVADSGRYTEARGGYGDPYFTDDQMHAYAAEQVAAERERCASRLRSAADRCDDLADHSPSDTCFALRALAAELRA